MRRIDSVAYAHDDITSEDRTARAMLLPQALALEVVAHERRPEQPALPAIAL